MDKTERKKTPTAKRSERTIEELMEQASQAQAEYEYAESIELYSQALADEGITAEAEYESLDRRAECYDRVGQFRAERDDLDKIVEIAQEFGNPEMQVAVVFRRISLAERMGENEKVKQIAESTRDLAQEIGEDSIRAGTSLAMGYYYAIWERYSEAQDDLEKALRLYRAIGDSKGEANSLTVLSLVNLHSGQQTLAGKYALDALAIWRALGDRRREASALNAWALTISDYAQGIDAKEEALEIFKEIGDRWGQGQMYNNLSLLYGQMGLYSTAREYAEQAVEMAREMGARRGLELYLDSLARAEMNMGDYKKSRATFKECMDLTRELGHRTGEAFIMLGLGMVALASGNSGEARDLLQGSLDIFRENKKSKDLPTVLAWLGAAYLALDEPKPARRYTAEAVTEQEAIGYGGSEYPPQEIWWWHYLALTHELRQDQTNKDNEVLEIPENAWSALQKARQITFEGIASLSDEGLRRNYLNKVEINRQIITKWAHQAAARDLAIEGGASPPGNVQAQLQRQLAIGVRMNDRREAGALIDFIMDELIELSGAERAMLVLVDDSGKRSVAASYGFIEKDEGEFLKQAENLLKSVETARMHVLRQDVQQGDIDATSDNPLEALSVLCVPLLSKGKLSGFIYADNHAIFGNFTQADVDLLAAFANQVSAALENAELYQGLEQRVLERTEELRASNETLEQRNADLAVINEVQQGLAAKLDLQEIIDLVGDKLLTVFDTHELGIMLYETETGLCHWPYLYYRGKRLEIEPTPPKGFTGHIIETGKTLVVNEDLERKAAEYGSELLSDEITILKSIAYVPILYEGEVKGVIGLTETEREHAFDAASVRLVESVAASLGIALSNVRLFDETTQRAAELAVINSVQEGLAAELDIQAIYDLVGDTIRDVFDAQGVAISIYDHERGINNNTYLFELGERYYPEPALMSKATKQFIQERKSRRFNKSDELIAMGAVHVEGTNEVKSALWAPLLIGNTVKGQIRLNNLEKEYAFDDSDLRLLTTLANSMSVALENARLFEETNQRAAELAVINSVQEGLAAELDIQAIYDLVGEKIYEVFDAQGVSIHILDHDAQMSHHPFHIDSGERTVIKPTPFSEVVKESIKNPQPIKWDKPEDYQKIGGKSLEGTRVDKSVLWVPLVMGGKVNGFINVSHFEKEYAFSDADLRLLSTLANSLSVALENARLFDETTQRAAELAIINSVQEGLASQLDMQAVFDLVGDQIKEIFDAQAVIITTYDRPAKMNHPRYVFEKGERFYPDPVPMTDTAEYLIRTRKPLLIRDSLEKQLNELGIAVNIIPGTEISKSLLFVPLIISGEVQGHVSLQNVDREGAFNDSDQRLLSTLANSMSVALENARLFDETNRRAADLAVINEIQQGLSEKLEFQAIIDLVGDKLMSIFKTQNLSIVIYDAETELSYWPYANWLGKKRSIDPIPLGGFSGQVIKTGKSLVINEGVKAAAKKFDSYLLDEDTGWPKSMAYVPIISEGKSIGLIGLSDAERENAYDAASVRLIESLASSLGIALSNVRLFEEINQRAAELALVNQVQEGLAAELDMQAIYDLVGDTLREVFNTEGASITIYDLERGLDYCTYLYEEGERIYLEPHKIGEASQAFIKNRKPFKYDTLEEIEKIGGKIQEGTKAEKSGMWAPLLVGETVKGKLSVLNHEREYAYTESDLRLLTTLANSMSVSLENARLFDETNQRAAELAVINSVQEGLAAELDMQAIYDLVGEKIREVFNAQGVAISIYDHERGYINNPYAYELGERLSVDPFPINAPHKKFIQDHKPLMFNSVKEYKDFGAQLVKGTKQDQSGMWVPLMVGETVKGRINVFNLEEEHAFDEADLNLLTTLANSMSVSLENARLFEETNQRAAELAIINSVQEGLAEELDIPSIFELVGEKIREIFDAQVVLIQTYNHEQKMRQNRYYYEKGERVSIEPLPFNQLTTQLIETRRPVVINQDVTDRSVELGMSTTPGTEPAKSLIFVPMVAGDTVVGTVSLQNIDRENAFPKSAVRLLNTLTSSMSVALENARLFEETNQRAAELALINSVQQGLAAELDMQAIYDLVGDQIRDVFDAQAVIITTYDYVHELTNIHYMVEKGERIFPSPFPISSLNKHLIENRQPLLMESSQDFADYGSTLIDGTEYPKSGIFVPLMIGDSVRGSISLQNFDRERAYGEADVRLLSTLANSMSVALENARLFDETNRLLKESQQRAAELTTVNTVSQALSSELDMETLIELIGEQVRQIFSADITYVALLDQQTNLIEFPYAVGEDLEAMPYGEGLTSKIIDAGEPLLINEDVNRTIDEIGATHTGVDVQSYLGVPIMVGGQAIGVISVQSMMEVRQFNEDDVRLLSTIAANVSAAIRNAQLYQETQQRADEMAALTEIGREISATLELENVLERIANRARDLLSARTATIRLVEEDGSLPTVVAIGKHAEKHRNTIIQMGEGITGNVAKSGLAEIINDPRNDARIVHIPGTPQEEDELEAIIFAPLMISERVIGVMGLWRDRPIAGPFSKDDLNFLQSLARQAANAIENARLFQEVQRQKQYSEALLQNSPVAIMTTDLDNMVVSWNPAAENLFGYPASEAIGVNIRDLISNESVEEEISDIYEQLKRGERVNTVTQRFRKNGSPVDVELLSLPVVMDGKKVGLIAIYHDITELLKARHEAEAANEAKSAFLATMSHEIRTPMNGVIGMTSLLLDTDLDAEQRDFTETIRSSGEALLTVINDILDFSKIEAGKMELEEQPFNLRECLESSLDLLKFEASDKGVELAYEMEADVPAVIVGDITRLRQVLINLLNNGLKFTEQGEVVLSVSTKAVPILPEGLYTLHFSVRDTGIGIPPERVDRLFQAFSQVDASTSRKYGGTGLGLAISKRLSELMGGDMWVESVVGEGTTFHFTISAQASPDMKERDDLRGEQPQLSGKRILIVDDNQTNRRILTLQTRAWGMLPRDTSDPQQALKWIRQGDPFDLAILDYHMPGMDGIQLSHAIRETADFPLILFSSIGARETAMGEDQFAAFLMKPLKQSVLLDTLMNLFAGEVKKVEPEAGDEKIGFDPELAEKLPLRILLVEDNAVNQKLALRLLEQMGYRADLAGNGLEAIQAVGRQKYDVVLMDVQMPEMDGLEASRRICARWPRGERPHIIAMTANAMQGDRERCLAAGMDDYVSKPIRVNELVTALSKARPVRGEDEELAKLRRN